MYLNANLKKNLYIFMAKFTFKKIKKYLYITMKFAFIYLTTNSGNNLLSRILSFCI